MKTLLLHIALLLLLVLPAHAAPATASILPPSPEDGAITLDAPTFAFKANLTGCYTLVLMQDNSHCDNNFGQPDLWNSTPLPLNSGEQTSISIPLSVWDALARKTYWWHVACSNSMPCDLPYPYLSECRSLTKAQIPELEEWFSIQSSRYPISYLPDFKLPDGRNAISVWHQLQNSGEAPTWFNRYKGDTENQFDWHFMPWNLKQVDLDGDGVLDYISSFGRVFKGTTNGQPPQEPFAQLYKDIASHEPYTITDINNDGYDDAISNMSEGINIPHILFSILFGGPDLKKLKMTHVAKRPDFGYKEAFIDASADESKPLTRRFVSMSYDEYKIGVTVYSKWTSLVLRKMSVVSTSDSSIVELQTLDSLFRDTYNTGDEFIQSSSKFLRSYKTGKEYFVAEEFKNNATHSVIYEIINEKFTQVTEFQSNNRNVLLLDNDINGDGYEDWATRSGDVLYFFAGQRSGIDTIPMAKYPMGCSGREMAVGIGDVTGDNIGDVAIAQEDGCFRICKGRAERVVEVPTPVAGYVHRPFEMQQNYPNPVDAGRQTTVPLFIEKAGTFTLELFELDGRKIATLFDGFLPEGNREITIDLRAYNLHAGFYALRLHDDMHSTERGILVQ